MTTTSKQLGIWMDHANAHIIEFSKEPSEPQTITSKFTHEVKEDTLTKSESLMHNKEQHEQSDYYKQLGETIKKYDEVLLFGPTDAKVELFNLLKADHHFANTKIDVKSADKMTLNEQHAFVREHFTKD